MRLLPAIHSRSQDARPGSTRSPLPNFYQRLYSGPIRMNRARLRRIRQIYKNTRQPKYIPVLDIRCGVPERNQTDRGPIRDGESHRRPNRAAACDAPTTAATTSALRKRSRDRRSRQGNHGPPAEHHRHAGAALDPGHAGVADSGEDERPNVEQVERGRN